VTEGWTGEGRTRVAGAAGTVTLVEGMTFCISEQCGDIRPGQEQGLFFRDTRLLSRFELTIDGQRLDPLATHSPAPYAATFIARQSPGPGVADSTLLVVRRRYVGNGMREDITVRNLATGPARFALALGVDADFAGLFDVKEGRTTPRQGIERTLAGPSLRLRFSRETESRGVTVTADGEPTAGPDELAWALVLGPRAEVTMTVSVTAAFDGLDVAPRYRAGQPVEASQPATWLAAWRQTSPVISSPDGRLTALISTSAEDLGVLRIIPPGHPDRVVVAAGAPWFMTLFGRDSLLTSWMLLPLDPGIALGTLQTLAQLQGSTVDPRTEEEPGRIIHELRTGLANETALGSGNRYYGSVDATPLFVMLLGELRRWGLSREDVDALLPHADRALDWLEHYGDRDGDGFIEYQRSTGRGLVNQGWKDSFDAISFADGRPAEPPIALAEVQGYAYSAYLARAHLAREAGDHPAAEHWAHQAAALRQRFNAAFWLPERGYYALALDRDKRPVDALASNMGHCLWTGIVDQDKAASVAQQLLSPQMFTGFGVRTLATSMARYNPVSYHNGSVWPHDNAIVMAGLMRYGFTGQAQRVALAQIEAAAQLGSRLPELFCGFDRREFGAPVRYPTACIPQAWAAAAPLYLLRTLLRLDPGVPSGRVWCDPAVPDQLLPLRVYRLNVAGAPLSIEISAGGWQLHGLPTGLELLPAARRPRTGPATPRGPQGPQDTGGSGPLPRS